MTKLSIGNNNISFVAQLMENIVTENTILFLKESYNELFELNVWDKPEQILLSIAYPLAFECNGYDLAFHLKIITNLDFDVNDNEEVTLCGKPELIFGDEITNFKYIKELLTKFNSINLFKLYSIKHIYPSKPIDFSAISFKN